MATRKATARAAAKPAPKPPAKSAGGRDGDSVAAYLRKQDAPTRATVDAIRAAILAASSEVAEGFKWNSPSFYVGEERHFATVNVNPKRPADGVRVIFHQGAKVKDGAGAPQIRDDGGLLRWLATDRCAATFRDAREVAAREHALGDIVRQWIAHVAR